MAENFLVVGYNDWADEFSADSFAIYEDTTLEAVEGSIKQVIAEGLYFGTNEGWEENELCFEDFDIRPITVEQTAVLKTLFPSGRFGTGVFG